VDGTGYELLPRSRLARDKDRQIAQQADSAHCLEDSDDSLTLSDTSQLLDHTFDAFLFVPSSGLCLEELDE
jgi:hypothetical protein